MQDANEFIEKFGDFSFNDLAFGEVDNLALCHITYMALEKVSPETFDEEPKAFDQVCNELFSFNGNKHVAPGLVLTKGISKQMMLMAGKKRYAEMKMIGSKVVFKERPAVQFGAFTFLLPTGEIVVVFRGTDDSIVGWMEDADIYTKHGIPSYPLALEYLEQVNKKYPEGDLIVAGHSKGGNVALYAALATTPEIRARIKTLYNNEGPGFDSLAWFATPAYKELLPRYKHFVPTSSCIGMMLAHDNDYEVIKNKLPLIGLFQHDPAFWRVKDNRLMRAEKLSLAGRITDKFLNKFLFGIDNAQLETLSKIVDSVIMDGINSAIFGLSEFPSHIPDTFKEVSKAYSAFSDEDKAMLRKWLLGAVGEVADSVKEAVDDSVEARRSEKAAKAEAEASEEAAPAAAPAPAMA